MAPWILSWLGCVGEPSWFGPPQVVPDEGCPPAAAPRDPDTDVAIRVYLAQGVDPDRAIRHTRWAAAWWRSQGVALGDGGWERVGPDPILAGTSPDDLPGVLAPLGLALRERAMPAAHRVDVVFLEDLSAPGSPADRWFDPLTGLTLAPRLIERLPPEDPTRVVTDAIGLQGSFTPTVFVGLHDLEALPEERARFVLAHELGHALGLPHVTQVGNLMGPGFPRCAPGLDPEQREALSAP